MKVNVRIFRDIDELKIWGNELGFRFLRDPEDKTKYRVLLTDDDVDKLETFVRNQQAEIELLETEIELLETEIELLETKLFVKDAFLKSIIPLIESGLSRVKWAELLIKQLPEEHEGRNSWLLDYGSEK